MNAHGTGNRLTDEERAAALKIADLLIEGFGWNATPQGGAYWNEVFHALRLLAVGSPEAGE